MKIYDTNILIRQTRNNEKVLEDGFAIIEFNLLEWIRGKNKEQRKQEFLKLEKLRTDNNGEYCFKNTLQKEQNLLNSNRTPFQYKYIVAEKVALETLKDLIDICVSVGFIILTIIAISKSGAKIVEGEMKIDDEKDYEIMLINQSLSYAVELMRNPKTKRLIKEFLPLGKESTDLWFVKLFNSIIEVFNQRCKTISFKTINSKHLNCNELTENGGVVISSSDISKYVDCLVDARQNGEATKKLYKKLIASIILENKSFEFNHIIDLYLQYAAECLSAEFCSNDEKRLIWY